MLRPPIRTIAASLQLGLFVVCVAWLGLAGAMPAAGQGADKYAQVQVLLDQGQAAQALALLEKESRGKYGPRELFLRGTGRIILGELKTGGADLEKAVAEDPNLRQAWLNLAGLEIAEGDFPKAYELLLKARDIDPAATDNFLNLGAVLMMMGRKAEAKVELERYLAAKTTAEDYYLVATNYALGSMETEALAALAKAFARDERLRLRARADDRFALLQSLDYKVLLATDSYQLPAGHHSTAAAFRQAYRQSDETLLAAVLQALRQADLRYEPEIEANPKWALVWGDVRVKVYNQENGTGVVAVSAPPQAMSAADFQRKTQALFRAIQAQLGEG
jgi:hypothetical protein